MPEIPDAAACPVCSLIDLPHRPVLHLRLWARSVWVAAYGGEAQPLPRLAVALLVEKVFMRLDKLRVRREADRG